MRAELASAQRKDPFCRAVIDQLGAILDPSISRRKKGKAEVAEDEWVDSGQPEGVESGASCPVALSLEPRDELVCPVPPSDPVPPKGMVPSSATNPRPGFVNLNSQPPGSKAVGKAGATHPDNI